MTKKTIKDDHPSSFVGLIDVISGRKNVDPELHRRLESVRQLLVAPKTHEGPFLTVLVRTQGRRLEPLKDALLCLAGQTVQDFEVILLEHNATKDAAREVRAIVDRLEPEFGSRVRILEVKGGTRSKPLNAGVHEARGRYIAIYDDDDLVFADWIEQFRDTAGTDGDRLARAVVANQVVVPEIWPQGQSGFRTASWPNSEYPKTFDLLQHMLVNYSPFMSWAFPRALFFTYGMRFDENLTVAEDWDVILRGSLLLGVDDVPALTAIYRRWVGGESSYTSHDTESWRASEQAVIDRIDEHVIMMPVGSFNAMRRMVLYNTALDNYRFIFNGTSLRRPLNWAWDAVRPGFRVAVKVRNRIRRLRAR
ncbi:MAG: glycosyltransferase family 2 protein [Rhodoglobus sp.]